MTLFEREDLADGLRQLVVKLHATDERISLRIVGGAALALRHFERATTRDIDVAIETQTASFAKAVSDVALDNGWDNDWLNGAAQKYVPTWGRAVDWETIHDDGKVVIQVAPASALLAMKLRANRPGRDNSDIALLMAICHMSTVDELDELYGEFYPGDSLDDRAIHIVENVMKLGIPTIPAKPDPPDLSSR